MRKSAGAACRGAASLRGNQWTCADPGLMAADVRSSARTSSPCWKSNNIRFCTDGKVTFAWDCGPDMSSWVVSLWRQRTLRIIEPATQMRLGLSRQDSATGIAFGSHVSSWGFLCGICRAAADAFASRRLGAPRYRRACPMLCGIPTR